MKLAEALSETVSLSKSEIKQIAAFASEVDRALSEKEMALAENPPTDEELAQLRSFVDAAKVKKRTPKFSMSDRLSALIRQMVLPMEQRRFLAEMALSYLVSQQETFIKNYLLAVLTKKRELLKTNATVTYEEIISQKSLKRLWASLAQKEVDRFGYGGIDGVADYFSKKFKIDLAEEFPDWAALREHSYRRNLIIHNQGKVDEKYRRNVASKIKIGRHIHTDMSYVSGAARNVAAFIDYVHSNVCKKFKLKDLTVRSTEPPAAAP